ncbi:MAG TPA: EAL domain-containing protein [Anaerolineales bacterium]|nr:EAL domain-containing protein [Anaerolineales bacterium]
MKKLWLRYWNNHPLAVKFTLVIVFLVTMAVTSVTGLSIYRERINFQSQVEGQARAILDSAAALTREAVGGEEAEALEHYADDLLLVPHLTHIAFYDREGNILIEQGDGEAPDKISTDMYSQPNPIFFWQNHRLHAVQGLWTPGELLGGVTIQMEMAPVLARETDLRNQGILVASLTIIAGIIMAVLFSRSVTTPLGELVRASRSVSLGEMNHPVPADANDEIGEVARAFNDMVDTLNQAREDLENRVRKRTLDLEEANQRLQIQMAELETTREALQESEQRFSLAAQGANDGIWDWDIRTDQVYYSDRWKSMLGLAEAVLDPSIESWLGRIHRDDIGQVRADLHAHLEGATNLFESEHRILHKNGTYLWVLSRGLAVKDAGGVAYRMAGSQTDTTERKKAEEQLLYDAFHDSLTGLPNRALFIDRVGRAIERVKRLPNYRFAVLFLDLDRFKVINDSLGHSIGDQLLIGIARRLELFLRSIDTVARLGGDEFVILIEDIVELEDTSRVARRILDEVALPFYLDDQKVFSTVSIGVVHSIPTYERPEDILRDADIAMYRAKSLGRARFEIFESSMRASVIARLAVENDLRRAIGFQEFKVHYQPILDLKADRIIGFEALIRWDHPDRGLIPPEEFIPIAEETGLIIPIDWWVLRKAAEQLAAWQNEFPLDPPLTMSVNVSSQHFHQLDLVKQVENILEITGLDPRCLKIEITENVFMESETEEVPGISELRSMGVQLQIDDFGTGYSSLGYLQRFPIDTIKIDRSFVSRMEDDSTNAEIVRTILKLARELDMTTIAEGVETTEQMQQLKDLACEFGQGFLISHPVSQDEATLLIQKLLRKEEVGI